ncbi:MAG: hypothetical protein AB1646_11720 [Thermodesulfobacteriota bacterium]
MKNDLSSNTYGSLSEDLPFDEGGCLSRSLRELHSGSSSEKRLSVHLSELKLAVLMTQAGSSRNKVQEVLRSVGHRGTVHRERVFGDAAPSYSRTTVYRKGDHSVQLYEEPYRKTDPVIILQAPETSQDLFASIRKRLCLKDGDCFVQDDRHLAICSDRLRTTSDLLAGRTGSFSVKELSLVKNFKPSITKYVEDIVSLLLEEGFSLAPNPPNVPPDELHYDSRSSFKDGGLSLDVRYGKKLDGLPDMMLHLNWQPDVPLETSLNDLLLTGISVRPQVASLNISSVTLDFEICGFGSGEVLSLMEPMLKRKRSLARKSVDEERWTDPPKREVRNLPVNEMLRIGKENDNNYHVVIRNEPTSLHVRFVIKSERLRNLGVHSLEDFFVTPWLSAFLEKYKIAKRERSFLQLPARSGDKPNPIDKEFAGSNPNLFASRRRAPVKSALPDKRLQGLFARICTDFDESVNRSYEQGILLVIPQNGFMKSDFVKGDLGNNRSTIDRVFSRPEANSRWNSRTEFKGLLMTLERVSGEVLIRLWIGPEPPRDRLTHDGLIVERPKDYIGTILGNPRRSRRDDDGHE